MARTKHPMALARLRYARQRAQAKFRNIGFNLSFDEWYSWWMSNGVDKNQPATYASDLERYCMCRIGDVGPYALNNIYFANAVVNVLDRNNNKSLPRKQKPLTKIYKYLDCLYTRSEMIEQFGIPEDQVYRFHKDHYDRLNKEMSLRLIRRHQRDVKLLFKWWTVDDLRFRTATEAASHLGFGVEKYKRLVAKGVYSKIKAPEVPLDVLEHIRNLSPYPDPYIPEELIK